MSREYTNPDDELGRSRQVGPLSPERLAQIEQTKLDFANYTPETHDEIMARMAKLYVDGSPEQKRYLEAHYRAPPGGWKAAAGFVVPAVLAAATGGATAGLGGLTSGAAAGGIAGASRAAITGGNILQDTLYGAAIGGAGGALGEYFNTPTYDSNVTGPQPGWAGGTPVNSGYNSPIEFGPELGYDTSIFGDAPPNLGNMSNSGATPYSPFAGGDPSPLTDSIPSIETIKDYPITPVDITGSTGAGSVPITTDPSSTLETLGTVGAEAGAISGITGAIGGTAANTLSSTIPANGTNTLTGAASALIGAGTAANLITGAGGVLSGINDLISSGNTSDLQNTIQQRSDPFGSQREFYQGQLKDSYTNPFGSAENQGLLNMYQQAAARKAAANGQRSNPLHQNIAFSNAMLPQLNEQRKTLGNLAGAGIDPNGGNAALVGLNNTGSDQRTNGFGQAYQGLQSLYNYFQQP